jgi:hypothetical protein
VVTPSFGLPALAEEDENSPKNKRKDHSKIKLGVSFLPRIPEPPSHRRQAKPSGTDRSSFLKNETMTKRPPRNKHAPGKYRHTRIHTECELFVSGKSPYK